MRREIRELDLSDLSRPPAGEVSPWVRWVVGCAAASIVGVAAIAARGLWDTDGRATGLDAFWFRNALWLVLAGAIAAAYLPGARISRVVRLAALLPVILLGGMLAAWAAWEAVAPRMPFLREIAGLVLEVPIWQALAGIGAATAVSALAIARRSPGGWVRALVAISLVDLLLLGLWLPLVSSWWAKSSGAAGWNADAVFSVGAPRELMALVLGPPLVVATAFAAVALRRPDLAHRVRVPCLAVLGVLLLVACSDRMNATHREQLVYVNVVHFLAASAFVATAALVALVASLRLRDRAVRRRLARDPSRVVGAIPDDDREDPHGVVACLVLEGWLAGPRALVGAFEVATPAGRVPVPIGAELAASLPAVSTALHVGEAVSVIRRGDRVVVGGMVEPPADHPFRSSAARIPGPDGVVVCREGDRGGDLATAALVAWRPCVALLVILTAVALPGLAAALALV